MTPVDALHTLGVYDPEALQQSLARDLRQGADLWVHPQLFTCRLSELRHWSPGRRRAVPVERLRLERSGVPQLT